MPTELADGIWWLDRRGVNAYLVEDDDALTLVDAGNPWDAGAFDRALASLDYGVSDVDRILLTHYDLDHVGTLGRLNFGATVYVGEADAAYVTGEEKPPWRNHKGAFQRLVSPALKSVDAVETVSDGDTVGSFTVHATPGHTPGHVAYVSEFRSAAFVGDLVMESDGDLSPSPYVMSYDTTDVRVSIRTLVERGLEYEVLAMGHGVPFAEKGSERLAALADSF